MDGSGYISIDELSVALKQFGVSGTGVLGRTYVVHRCFGTNRGVGPMEQCRGDGGARPSFVFTQVERPSVLRTLHAWDVAYLG